MAKYAYNFDDPKVKKPKYTYSFEEEEETVKPEQPDGPLTLKVPFTDLKYDIGQTPVIGKPLEKVATGFSGVMGRTAAGMEKGLTLGAIDPERGTIGIPILQNVLPQTRLQILSPENGMAKQMEQQGVPKVIAENPYIGLPGELAGSTAPIGLISRGISGGVSAITGGAKTLAAGTKLANAGQKVAEGSGLLQKTGKVAGRLGHAATVGGIVGTTEDIRPGETIADNIKRGAVWGAGLQVLGEGVGAIGNATKMIDKMKAYRSLKDSLAEWAYGEGRYNSLDAAKKDIGQMISNDIKRAGGLKSVTKEQAQKMRDFIKAQGRTEPIKVEPEKVSAEMARLREEVLAERPEVAPTEIQPRIKTWSKEDALKAIENTVNQGKNGKAEITPVVKPPQNNEAVSLSKEPWEMTKEEITKVIDNTSLGKKYPPTPFQVDWGPRQRGQGKRVGGGMIVGGMSDAPRGIKTYSNLLGSVPEYKENPGEFRGFSQFDKIQYLKAREYGLNHNQAILYQAIHNPEFKNIADDKLQERMKFYSDKQQSPVTEPLPIDQTVKQAGFDSLGEAHLAFVAKEKGFKQFAQELGVKPSKESAAKFIELKKRLGSLPADVQNQLRIDLQLFSQSHKAATGKEMTWNDYLNKEKMDSLRANYRQRVADIQTKAKTEKKIAVNLATKKEVWRRLLNEKDAKIKYQGKIAELREKAKKQAEIAKKKGMWRQLLNKQDAEERHAKNKYIDKIKKVDAKHMRPEFQRPVKAILDEINLVAPSKKTANKLNRIAQYLETHPDNNIPQTTINKLKRLSRKNIRDMSLEEVETVYDAVYHYVHLNKLKNKLIFGRTYKDAEIVDNEAATNVINYRKSQNDPAVLKDEGGSSASPARKYFMLSKNMETLAEELDGSPNGVIKTVAYDGINEGVSKQIEFRRKVSGEIKNSFKDAGIVNKDILPWSEAFQVKKKNVQYKVYKLQNGQELTLTPAERIDLYLHNKSGDNMRHIFGGGLFKANDKYTRYKITQVDVDNILADMGDKEKQVAEAFSKVYNGIVKDGINKTSVELNGYEMATTPNYNPIKVNGMEIKHDPLKPRNPGYSAFSIEGMGILKERSGGKNGILIEDAFTKLFAHIEKSSAYVGLAKPLRNVKMLVAGRKMKWELGKIDAGFTARRFDNYIKDIEGSMIDIEDVDKLTLDLIHKIDTAILGINPWVIMKQPISYLMEANEISAKYLTQAVFSKGDLEEIKKYSPQLAERIEGDVTVELGELGKVGAVRHFFTGISPISSKLTEGIVWADNQTVGRTWNAVKKEVKAEHPELKGDAFFEAVAKRTEEIYRKTQSAFQPKDRSELGRSKSVWMRMMTRFTSQRNICFNAMIRARTQFNYSHKTIGDKAAYMGKLFNIIVVSSLAVGAVDRLRNAVYGRKQEGAIGTGIKTISDAMSYFYIVGDVFAAIIDKTQRGTFAGRDWSSPFMQTANNFIDTVADVNRAISQVLTQERYKSGPNSGEVKWKRTAAKATNETLAFVSKIKGLPYENIQRLLSKPVTALAQSPEDRRYNQLKVKYDEWYTQWKEGVKVRKSVPITKEAREFLGLKAKREQAKAIREAEAYKKMSAAR